MQSVIVTKSIEIDSAHFLPNYAGKCAEMHGHRWKIEIGCEGEVDKSSGMVIDFNVLKLYLKKIDDLFDHKVLNKTLEVPTAENIGLFIFMDFNDWCDRHGLKARRVKVWETPDSCVEVVGSSD